MGVFCAILFFRKVKIMLAFFSRVFYIAITNCSQERGGKMSRLGEYLKSRRKILGLSLREVQERSGVSNAYLSMIESGKRPAPHPKILVKLAEVYDVGLRHLMALAGYLELTDERERRAKIERRFNEVISDTAFSFGHRLGRKRNIDFEMKEFIVDMYEKLKAKKREEERKP